MHLFCMVYSKYYNSVKTNLFIFKQGSKLYWTYFEEKTIKKLWPSFDKRAKLDLRSTNTFLFQPQSKKIDN